MVHMHEMRAEGAVLVSLFFAIHNHLWTKPKKKKKNSILSIKRNSVIGKKILVTEWHGFRIRCGNRERHVEHMNNNKGKVFHKHF